MFYEPRPAIQSRIVTVPRILWEESAHQVRRDPFRPVFDPGTDPVWALVFLLYACVTLFFATGTVQLRLLFVFFFKDCTCCVAQDAGVRVGRHPPLLVLRLVVGRQGRSRFVSILLVFDRPVDGRTLCLKKLLFRNLVLCEENYFFLLYRDKNFYLPFLAHGLERFLLLVAVGEAGRPNVNDDLCFC